MPIYSLFLSPTVNNLTEATQERRDVSWLMVLGVQSIITREAWRPGQLHLWQEKFIA